MVCICFYFYMPWHRSWCLFSAWVASNKHPTGHGRKESFFLSLETLKGYMWEAMEWSVICCWPFLAVAWLPLVGAFRGQLLPGLAVQATLLLLILR